MSYVFSDQQAKLDSLIGDSEESTDSMFPTAVRKKELNRGELNFATDSKIITEYATGTVANKEIDVPSDWLETYVLIIDNVVITNDREISVTQWERYQDWGGDRPFMYYWEFSGTRKIKLFGTVNGKTYKLFYFKRPTTELDADGDVSLIPEEYREAPVFFAASELMLQIGKTELANRFREQYQFYVDKAKLFFEKNFVNNEYPKPDFGEEFVPENDVQGQGLGVIR